MGTATLVIAFIAAILAILKKRTRDVAPGQTISGGGATLLSPQPSRADMPPAPADLSWSSGDLESLIRQISTEERFELPEVAIAIARVESSMDPRAVNPFDGGSESLGLFQMKLWLAQHYNPAISGRADMLTPELNIRAAVRWLRDLVDRYLPELGLDAVIQMHSLGETKYRAGSRNAAYLAKVRAELEAVAKGR